MVVLSSVLVGWLGNLNGYEVCRMYQDPCGGESFRTNGNISMCESTLSFISKGKRISTSGYGLSLC